MIARTYLDDLLWIEMRPDERKAFRAIIEDDDDWRAHLGRTVRCPRRATDRTRALYSLILTRRFADDP